jgi:predicted SAM-dependent methyltransferase
MITRGLREAYYLMTDLPMRLNGIAYKAFRQPREPIKAHLGCGRKNYLAGWVNLDANMVTAHPDVWANLLRPLPFRDSSVECFYSFHVIEHLPDSYLPSHFREMYRCLIPGGRIRVGGPDIGNACRKYLEGDIKWFSAWPDSHASIGGRFTNFVFCSGEHLTALTESYLGELCGTAGFRDIQKCLPCRETGFAPPEVLRNEFESDFECPHSILIEARK